MQGKANHAPAGRWTWVLASLLLLVPCYWQPRIQGGDLSSRMYNSWLTQWVETGHSQGIMLVGQTSNVLFDLLLSGLFRIFNAEFAQRIAVSLAVLTFAWGAFAFVSAVSGRRPWHLLSCIAIMAYGWVFHMGFFNFYLSMGLCFWMLALLWHPSPLRIAWALPLGILAYIAHLLPLLWTLAILAYLWMAGRVSQRLRGVVTLAIVLAMLIFHYWVDRTLFSAWTPTHVRMGGDWEQGWFFDAKYYLVLAGLLLAWGILFLEMLHDDGPRKVVASVPFQICVVSVMAVVVLPASVLIPGFTRSLVYIAERMSLGVGICVCALLGSARPRVLARYTLLVVALIFFGFLYGDERKLNSYEDRRQDTVARLEYR